MYHSICYSGITVCMFKMTESSLSVQFCNSEQLSSHNVGADRKSDNCIGKDACSALCAWCNIEPDDSVFLLGELILYTH